MKRILEDINTGQLKHVYLLFGEENYLIRQYMQNLREALNASDDDINTTRFVGRDVTPEQVIDMAETMPFFADHRSIFLDDTGFFKRGGEEMKALTEYINEIPESTYLVFTESEVDRRGRLYKQVAKEGRAAEFARQKEDALTRWVLGKLKKEEKMITREVLEMFMTRTGNDMDRISRELEKLLCYTMGRDVISAEDVESVCGSQVEDRVFDMVDAVAAKQQRRAMDLYYDLLTLKEAPMRILSLIRRQFNILFQLKEMSSQGFDRAEMAGQVGVREYFIPKYLKQAGMFTESELLGAVRDSVQAEEDFKTGRMSDRLAVELFLIEYSK